MSSHRAATSPLHLATLCIFFTTLFIAGCDVGSPEYEPIDAPPLHLLDVALYGVDENGNATEVSITPDDPVLAAATRRVQTTSSLRLRFDRFLLPGNAIRQSMCLMASADPVPTIQECIAGAFLEPSYDPVRRTVTYRLAATTPLLTNTKYWLTVLSPTDKSPFGFTAFDGARLASNVVFQFTTATTNPPGGPADPPLGVDAKRTVSEELFCVASACVAACGADETCAKNCAVGQSLPVSCGGCHAPLETGLPPMGLDLSGPERIGAIIGRVAHQTQTGAHADEADDTPRRFGRAMPQIDPGSPGNSYLLYKMLIAPTYASSSAAQGIAPREIDRLRESVVVGLPMSPYGLAGIPEGGVDALSAWISTGAATPACP